MALYVGFDCSTQSLTVVVIDSDRQAVVLRESWPFAEPFIRSEARDVVHASPSMWQDALVVALEALAQNIDCSALRAISGSAQQHGSVYCGTTPQALTRATAPIWMDSSTARECAEIENALGGPAAAAELTGSRVYPRFTGPQIRKFARREPAAYERTVRIHLVSSYMASLMIGSHAPVDYADGSGMALMDIRARRWAPAALEATAPALHQKLPPLIESDGIIGTLSATWGLPPTRIVAWSGDNPCSMVGTGVVAEGQLAISLGTSDTVFGPMSEVRGNPTGVGHVFASAAGDYMGITVFRNGALAREEVRDSFGLDWQGFSAALRSTPAGNEGAMMLPWFDPEITPQVAAPGVRRFGLDDAPPARHVRALVEAQAMALARHSEWMGIKPRVIHATGGAAANREILQVIADVFDADVQRFESTDSAALGAALRALQADTHLPWREVIGGFVKPLADPVRPKAEHVAIYAALRPVYAERERAALSGR